MQGKRAEDFRRHVCTSYLYLPGTGSLYRSFNRVLPGYMLGSFFVFALIVIYAISMKQSKRTARHR